MENTSAKLTPKPNPKAISIRLGSRSYGQVTGSRNHDLRLGRIPNYVNKDRLHLNDILITPATAPELRNICEKRRANRKERKARRGLRSDAAVMRDGIVTFGTEAQKVFETLDRQTQNEAFTAIAEGIARRLKTTLAGLVVHRDENSTHAHFDLVAVNNEGHPISQVNSQSDIGRLQDLAAEIIAKFAPEIERGHKKYDRLKAGARYSDTVHRSVKQLHEDLPLEIEAKQVALAKLNKNIAATEAKLKEGTADEERLKKRLATYQERLARQMAELESLQAIQKALHQKIIDDAKAEGEAEKKKIIEAARVEEQAIKAQAEADRLAAVSVAQDQARALIEGFELAAMGKIEPVMRDSQPKWLINVPLDGEQRTRLSIASRMGLRALVEKFQDLVKSLQDRVRRVTKVVADLEELRDEMTAAQQVKFDRAKAKLDFEEPNL